MLRKMLDKVEPLFHKGGRLEKLYPLYEANDTFLYTPGETAEGSTHVRDAIDLKRMMSMVIVALLPCILMAMYNLVLFFAIKDKVYLLYIGYLLSAFFVLSGLTGFGYLIFSTETQLFVNKYLLFIDYYLVIFLLAFTLLFLRYDQQKNKTYILGLVLTALLIVCSFFSLTLDTITQTKLFFSIQPLFYIFALFILFRRLRLDFSWAKYYLFSWLPLLIGAAIQPLVLLNYLEYSFVQ